MIRSIRSIHKEAFLFAIIAVSGVCGFMQLPPLLYYVTLVALMLRYLVAGGLRLGSISLLVLLVVAVGSIVIAKPSAVFRSWERLALFVVVLLLVSPLVESKGLLLFRMKAFRYILRILTVLSALSFPCYYLGINFMIRGEMDYLAAVGGFGGLYSHSMLLGPMSAISSITLLSSVIHSSEGAKGAWRILPLVLLLCTMGSTLLSASRVAIFGMFLVFVVIFVKHYATGLFRFLRYSLLIGLLLYSTAPLWVGLFDRVMTKQQHNKEMGGGMFYSRINKWHARLYEINESPIIGVGFAAIDPRSGDYYERRSGTIEPGSSWLYILSSMGLLGFVAFVSFALRRYVLLIRYIHLSSYHATVAGSVLFLAISMVAEGYIFSAGSFLCLLVWLSFGNSTIAISHQYHD